MDLGDDGTAGMLSTIPIYVGKGDDGIRRMLAEIPTLS